jgi:CheY-like chemotaxis protein
MLGGIFRAEMFPFFHLLQESDQPMKPRFLIAHSDAGQRRRYRRLFSACGLRVFTARNGIDCLTQLGRVRPQVLLLDTQLLWGGSEGVLACLREDPALPRVRVVLLKSRLQSAAPAVLPRRAQLESRRQRSAVCRRCAHALEYAPAAWEL